VTRRQLSLLAAGLSATALFAGNKAIAAEQYVNATVSRIEVCDLGTGPLVTVLISATSGTTPSTTNGCSNDVSLPYVQLSSSDVEVRKAQLSVAFTAHALGRVVRIRYDDVTANRVISIAIL
jgi:hypothetical protein